MALSPANEIIVSRFGSRVTAPFWAPEMIGSSPQTTLIGITVFTVFATGIPAVDARVLAPSPVTTGSLPDKIFEEIR